MKLTDLQQGKKIISRNGTIRTISTIYYVTYDGNEAKVITVDSWTALKEIYEIKNPKEQDVMVYFSDKPGIMQSAPAPKILKNYVPYNAITHILYYDDSGDV